MTELTAQDIHAMLAHSDYLQTWQAAQASEIAYNRNQPGSHVSGMHWTREQEVEAMLAYHKGDRRPDWDTQDSAAIASACEGLGLKLNLSSSMFRGSISDPQNHDWDSDVAAVWFTPTGQLYAAHSTRYGFHIRDLFRSDMMNVLLSQLVAGREKQIERQLAELSRVNEGRLRLGIPPFESYEVMRWPRFGPTASPTQKSLASKKNFAKDDRVQYTTLGGEIRRGTVLEVRHSERPGVSHFLRVQTDNGQQITLASHYFEEASE